MQTAGRTGILKEKNSVSRSVGRMADQLVVRSAPSTAGQWAGPRASQ